MQNISQKHAIKNKNEIAKIKKSLSITEDIFAVCVKHLKTGVEEIKIHDLIIKEMKKRKITHTAFDPIVAFGKNTSHIHHTPTKNKLKSGDIVMLDFGATYQGYCADMTRTFLYKANNKDKEKIVLRTRIAKDLVLKALYKGERNTKKLDKIARDYIYKYYSQKSFPHSLGHGVGTHIHEWPSISPREDIKLLPGMVVTIEPGIYLEGKYGSRDEDMILIKKNSIEVLNKASFPLYIE
ncbi:MAG: M24 family metallopeptidase [Candidatus Paceibacterota bacterium]